MSDEQTHIKDSNYGPYQEKCPIDFDPREYNTPEAAAKAFYQALKPVVELYGQDPASELCLRTPEQSARQGYQRNWCVSWEAGPYEWGIVASMEFMFNREAGWFTEPYYSFDLHFTE